MEWNGARVRWAWTFDLDPRGAERGSILDPAVVQIERAWWVRVTMAVFLDCGIGESVIHDLLSATPPKKIYLVTGERCEFDIEVG